MAAVLGRKRAEYCPFLVAHQTTRQDSLLPRGYVESRLKPFVNPLCQQNLIRTTGISVSEIKIKLSLDSLNASNIFLRALWAGLRSEYPDYAWSYSPRREGQHRTIRFGTLQLRDDLYVDISVRYKTQGVIDEIILEAPPLSPRTYRVSINEEDRSRLQFIIHSAFKEFKNPDGWTVKGLLHLSVNATFHKYTASHVSITPSYSGRAYLSLYFPAFDQFDADYMFMSLSAPLCEQLTTWTNVNIFNVIENDPREFFESKDIPNCSWAEPDWIDGHALIKDRLAITVDQLAFLDAYAKQVIDHSHPIARAARHFAEALHLGSAGPHPETSLTLLVSALEVAGINSAQRSTCAACGQVIHKISKRVYDIALKHLGTYPASMVKRFYEHRSKFLHEGMLSERAPRMSKTTPQLNPADPSGCSRSRPFYTSNNLVEFTSYIIRAECLEWYEHAEKEKT